MEKIFYTDVRSYPDSETAVKQVFKRFFQIENATITRNENGKPFLNAENHALFFSVSHTNGTIFIAVSDENVGIDAESTRRKTQYLSIVKKFSIEEQKEIYSLSSFLKHWTAKEAAVKWLGGALSHDLNKLTFADGKIVYKNAPLPILVTFPPFPNYVLAVCSERDFSNAECIPF